MAHLNWGTGLDGATVDVQLGLGFAPATAIASITWTSIITYVRSLSYELGKSDSLDAYQPGRLAMDLDNRDRRFDPLHASGPYFGNLKPMTPIRVRETYSGTTVTAWTGFVSGFPQSYDPPRNATCSVTASDGFGVLARTIMPSLYAYEVTADTPSLWWRLGEQAGTTAVDASGNALDGTYDGGATFNSRTGLVVDSDNAIAFDSDDAVAKHGFAWPAYPFSIELWVSLPVSAAGSSGVIVACQGTGAIVFLSCDNITPRLLVSIAGYVSPPNWLRTYTANLLDGLTHHVVITFASGAAAPILYVDGVAVGSSSGSGTVPAVGAADLSVYGATIVATVDEFAIYPSALSAARALSHYNAGHAPYSGLDTGAAITKILDMIGWPSADRTIETGKSTVIDFDTSGMTALEVIQAMEKTERGRFFMAPDGKATFYNRHHTLTTAASTTSQATFGDSGSELPYGDLNLEFDDSKIRNSITTARTDGSPFNVKDAASITSYRERAYAVTGLLNASDGELRDLGYWLLGHYTQPVTRVPEIAIQPRRSPTTLFPHIRDRLLCDRITVKRRPQGVGSAISIDCLIEGMRHTLTRDGAWTTTLLLSPAETTGFFILDNATFGQLGLNALAF
jgi:hypothetical protein